VPYPNLILPEEPLSTRERILRKIHGFNGEPFTIDMIKKRLDKKERIKVTTLRYHLEDLYNNLYLRKLPRERRAPIQYQWFDGIGELLKKQPNEEVKDYLSELQAIARHMREGGIVHPGTLEGLRTKLSNRIAEVDRLVTDLSSLHDCSELWQIYTLVNRLEFREP
jgi:hypothetical protein